MVDAEAPANSKHPQSYTQQPPTVSHAILLLKLKYYVFTIFADFYQSL